MEGWVSIHQRFRDIEDALNYEDLNNALQNTNGQLLQRLAARLCCEEVAMEQEVQDLTSDLQQSTDDLDELRREHHRLQCLTDSIENEMPKMERSVHNAERRSRNFKCQVDKLRIQLLDMVERERKRDACLRKAFEKERNKKFAKLNDLFCSILVLRAGQLMQCESLEKLVKKKPAVLKKFKEQLRCKRKRLMHMQVNQEEACVQETCSQQRQLELRNKEYDLREKETAKLNRELDRIRQQKAAMDGLVRSYTEELYKATELPLEVIHMKRFFQSLHKHSGGSSQPVPVERSESNRDTWEQAAVIQRLQKDLAYYYQQNFLLQTDLTEHLLDHQLHAVAIEADRESFSDEDACNSCDVNECGEPIPTCHQEPTPACYQEPKPVCYQEPTPTCYQEPPACPVSPRLKEPQSSLNTACPLKKKERTSSCSPCSSSSRSPPSMKEKILRRFASSDNELVPKLSSGFVPQSACSTKSKCGRQPPAASHKTWTRVFRSKERTKPAENSTVCSLNKSKPKNAQNMSPCPPSEPTVCERPKSSCKTADESIQCSYRPPTPHSPRVLGTSNSDGSLIEHHRQPFLPISPRVNFKDTTFTKADARILSGDQSRSRFPGATPPPSPVAYPFSSYDMGSNDSTLPPLRSLTPSSDFTQTDFEISSPSPCPRASECTQTQATVSSKEASCEVAIPVVPPPPSPLVNDRGAEWRELARKILTTSVQAEYLGINKYKTCANLRTS